MIGIFPGAITFSRTDIAIRAVGNDPVPEKVKRLVEALSAVGAEHLWPKEARAAGQDADHQIFVDAGIIGGVEDERATGITASRCALIGGRIAKVEVEIVGVGARRIVEIEPVEVLRQIAERSAEQEIVAIVEGDQGTNEVFGGAAAPVNADGIAGCAGTAAAIAGEIDVIAGARLLGVAGRRWQGGKKQGPGRHFARRGVEHGECDITFEKAETIRIGE